MHDNVSSVNVNVGEKDDRMMTTGLHTVCDIFCVTCGSILGWKYVTTALIPLCFSSNLHP
jgi:hypothetical protein